jgi:hypothetical protein
VLLTPFAITPTQCLDAVTRFPIKSSRYGRSAEQEFKYDEVGMGANRPNPQSVSVSQKIVTTIKTSGIEPKLGGLEF